MNRLNDLANFGFSLSELYSYINEEKLILKKNDIYVNDYNVLMNIIKKTNDRFLFRHYTDLQIDYQLTQLFRLIRIGKNEMAHKLAELIYKNNQIPEVKLIIDNLTYEKDSINYILEEEAYDNEEVINKYKNMEIEMLLDFYQGNIEQGGEKLATLVNLYINQVPIFYKAYVAYITKIDELKLHYTKINKRNREGAIGDPLAVVTGLLIQEDFYRAHNILKEYYMDNIKGEYSVIWEILRILDRKLMVILAENERNVNKKIELDSNGLNDESTIVGEYDLSSLKEEQINKMVKENDEIDTSIDYHKVYLESLEKHKYAEAKDAIIKYIYITEKNGNKYNRDHLVYEVDIKKENYENCSEEDLNKRDELVLKGNNYLDEYKYKDALEAFKESLKYEKHKSPSTLSQIGECYVKLGKYLDAYITYKLQERDYLYPDDYIYLIECLYRLKITERAEYYVSVYEEKNQLIPSSFLHYILSLIHLENKNYDKALDEIDTCEIICMEDTGLPLKFYYERNIIHALKNGKQVLPYVLENYYDHTFSEKELNKIIDLGIDDIDEGEVIDYIKGVDYGESLEEMIDYLLTLYMVLKEMDRRKDAKDLLIYLEEIIQSPELSEYDKNNFTQVLKNYRNL